MFKRVTLFVMVNLLVVATISISTTVLGIAPYLSSRGISASSLLIFCAIFGFSGSVISLLFSREMAKMMLNVQVIEPRNATSSVERFLLRSVEQLAQQEGFTVTPQVGIYESPEVNAFATGPSRNHSLVAVSTGLLRSMDQQAIEGVLAHEVAHISNGDMVTMTLLQGVINTFVMFFARVIALAVVSAGRDEDDREPSYAAMYMVSFVLEMILGILGSIVICFFSRVREFAADKGGARLVGKHKMIHALRSLQQTLELVDHNHRSLAAFKISGGLSMAELFSTHPPLQNRIEYLQNL